MIFETKEEAMRALKVIAASVVDAEMQAAKIAVEHDIGPEIFEKFVREGMTRAMLNEIQEKLKGPEKGEGK